MTHKAIHVITGAFGFSGKYIAKRLLKTGCEVRTVTNSPDRENPFNGQVKAYPFNFDKPVLLARSLEGATVLYNTYWVRFNHSTFSHKEAVRNTLALFEAAKMARVERIVHVSITNPLENWGLEYFSDKAHLEKALMTSGMSHAILRPAVLFGEEDILINNIAWILRRFPIFGVFGDGKYKIQPIHVDDLAALAVEQGQSRKNTIIEAIGPETFTYLELVSKIGRIIGKNRPIVPIPPAIGYLASKIFGLILRDNIVTREEIKGLMAGTLAVDAPPAGQTRLTDWVARHADSVGAHYASELARRRNRRMGY